MFMGKTYQRIRDIVDMLGDRQHIAQTPCVVDTPFDMPGHDRQFFRRQGVSREDGKVGQLVQLAPWLTIIAPRVFVLAMDNRLGRMWETILLTMALTRNWTAHFSREKPQSSSFFSGTALSSN